ncbi:MAG: hypothetical protein HC828_05960 [Blastochloris sp.]|nr:hypothetical protein [Blastochloris sp.]
MTMPLIPPRTIEQCVIGTVLSLVRLSKEQHRRDGVRFFVLDDVKRRFPEWLDVVLMHSMLLGLITDEDTSNQIRSDILVSLTVIGESGSPHRMSQVELVDALTDLFADGTALYVDYGARSEVDDG